MEQQLQTSTIQTSTLLRNRMAALLNEINTVELEQASAIRAKQNLENQIKELQAKVKDDKEALDIATHAIEILRQVSDEAVSKAYEFLQDSLNTALARMFTNTTRKIRIKEYTRSGQYPQLELELQVGNGVTRSLKTDSGHGLAQIVSLLSILSLIVITNSRRILVMDEVISGLSVRNRQIVTAILWSFVDIGFQFIVNDHGFIPEGSHVYHLQMDGDVSHVKNDYIAKTGVYLQGAGDKEYDYKERQQSEDSIDETYETEETIDETEALAEEQSIAEDNGVLSI